MWSDRGHMQILLADDTAIYKQASNSTKSEIGVILISDTMGSELRGSRQVMELFAENGINIVKPMLFEKDKLINPPPKLGDTYKHRYFSEMVIGRYDSLGFATFRVSR